MAKLYERNGQRFVTATDHTGHYLNSDYTLSEEKTENSIAICVLHTVKEMIFCELNDNPPRLNLKEAKEYCSKKFLGRGRLPEIQEILLATSNFRNIFPYEGCVWSNSKQSEGYALSMGLYYCAIYNERHTLAERLTFAFLTVDL